MRRRDVVADPLATAVPPTNTYEVAPDTLPPLATTPSVQREVAKLADVPPRGAVVKVEPVETPVATPKPQAPPVAEKPVEQPPAPPQIRVATVRKAIENGQTLDQVEAHLKESGAPPLIPAEKALFHTKAAVDAAKNSVVTPAKAPLKLSLNKPATAADRLVQEVRKSGYENPMVRGETVIGNAAVDLDTHDGKVWLKSIRALEKRQGAGTEALTNLKKMADTHGVEIFGEAVPLGTGGMSKKRLLKWYKDNGFEVHGEDIRYVPKSAVASQASPVAPPPVVAEKPVVATPPKATNTTVTGGFSHEAEAAGVAKNRAAADARQATTPVKPEPVLAPDAPPKMEHNLTGQYAKRADELGPLLDAQLKKNDAPHRTAKVIHEMMNAEHPDLHEAMMARVQQMKPGVHAELVKRMTPKVATPVVEPPKPPATPPSVAAKPETVVGTPASDVPAGATGKAAGPATARAVNAVADPQLEAIGLGGIWARKTVPKFEAAANHAERVKLYEAERKVLHPDKLEGFEKWFNERYPEPVRHRETFAADVAREKRREMLQEKVTTGRVEPTSELLDEFKDEDWVKTVRTSTPDKPSAINHKEAGFKFDLESARVGMDKRGYAEYGEHKVKVVPHANGGTGDKATYAVEHYLSDGKGGAVRTTLPKEYKTLGEAQNAALNELSDRVGGGTPIPTSSTTEAPAAPAYKRVGLKEADADRQARRERIADLESRISPLNRKLNDVASKEAKTPHSHNKKKAALRQEADALGIQVGKLKEEQRKLTREQDLQLIEDSLENPKSHEHYLKSMSEYHDRKRHEYREMTGTTAKERALGRAGAESAMKNAEHHSAESDKHALELIDRIKAKLPADKLNKDELQSAAEDVYRDFGDRTDMKRAVEASVARRLEARKEYRNADIDKLTFLDDAKRNELKTEMAKVKEAGGSDWHTKLEPIIAKGKTANEEASVINTARVKAEAAEKAKQAEIAAAGELKSRREQNRAALTEPRYLADVARRAKEIRGTVEKMPLKGTIAPGASQVIERETLNPTWKIETSRSMDDSGKFVNAVDLVHTPSGTKMTGINTAKNAREFVTMLDDQGIDLGKYTKLANAPQDVQKQVSRVTSAWNNSELHHLNDAERAAAMTKVKAPRSGIRADIVLGADDLGHGGESHRNVKVAPINPKLKMLAEDVPEFAYNPVMTVSPDKKLVFRDGYKYEFDPEAFNLHPSELTPGQTVGVNLPELGITKASEQDVVMGMFRHAGWQVSKTGNGVKAVRAKGEPAVIVQPAQAEQWRTNVGTTAAEKKRTDAAQEIIDKIRWTQPGQVKNLERKVDIGPPSTEHPIPRGIAKMNRGNGVDTSQMDSRDPHLGGHRGQKGTLPNTGGGGTPPPVDPPVDMTINGRRFTRAAGGGDVVEILKDGSRGQRFATPMDAIKAAQKAPAKPAEPITLTRKVDVAKDADAVYKAMSDVESGADLGTLVAMRDLRKRLPEMSKERFDEAVMELGRTGRVMPHRHDYVANMTEKELAELVDTKNTENGPNSRYFVGMARRRKAKE